jgi:hypothetical protein
MRVVKKTEMKKGLIDHPYDSSPGYLAKINFFYLSEDKKAFTSLWTAPKGRFTFRWDIATETIFIISGKLEVISVGVRKKVEAGDCIIGGNNEEIEFIIEEDVEAIISLYPITIEVIKNIEKLTKELNLS